MKLNQLLLLLVLIIFVTMGCQGNTTQAPISAITPSPTSPINTVMPTPTATPHTPTTTAATATLVPTLVLTSTSVPITPSDVAVIPTIAVTPTSTSAVESVIQVEKDDITDLVWSPDGKTLVVALPHSIRLYKADALDASPRQLETSDAFIYSVAFSPDGTILAAGDGEGAVSLWDVEQETLITTLKITPMTRVEGVDFNSDGTILAVGGASHDDERSIVLIDPKTQIELNSFGGYYDWVNDIKFNSDGTILGVKTTGTCGRGGSGVSLLNLTTGEDKLSVSPGNGRPESMAFSPDGLLAVGFGEGPRCVEVAGGVSVWDLESGELLTILPRYNTTVRGLAFSPNNSDLLATTDGSAVRLWNVDTTVEVMSLPAKVGKIGLLAFSPDGTLAFSDDNLIRIIKLPPDLSTNPHASVVANEALVIEDFSGYSEDDLQSTYSVHTTSDVNQGSLRLENRNGVSVLAQDYSVNDAPSRIMAERCFVPAQDWTNARFLEVWVENDSQPKSLVIELGLDGENPCLGEEFRENLWRTSVSLHPEQSGMVNIPLDNAIFYPVDGSLGRNFFDEIMKVGYFAVGVYSEPGSGTIHIGTIRLWP